DITQGAFAADVARWADDAPPDSGQIVLAGSSSVRRWEGALQALAPWGVVQRGMGGARLSDVAAWADELIIQHRPSAVLLFAGTNDIAVGVEPDEVVRAWRCVVQRARDALGSVPVIYLGITPTPSRWSIWDEQDAVNREIARLSALHPDLGYADMPSAFLAHGSPPDAALFVDDGLHLSEAGYAIWTDVVLASLGSLPRREPPVGAPFGRIRVDLGPSNPEDGALAPAVDGFGVHWNAWPGARGSDVVLAGEALRGLTTTTGAASGVDLVITGGFRANGLRNGGLTSPPGERLGTLAVPEATEDFFYTEGPDDPAGFAFTGLDPASSYTLRLFASRASTDERRVTRYVARGGGPEVSGELVTTGPGVGAAGGNDRDVLVLSGVRPDAWGQLYVDVQRAEGQFAYVSLVELEGPG
ncbi:MAG TPA: GDSL-type esterase/lipase family protein, partial [Myxococcota bacterium]|nr:GDSL-type esterase/lipase family protein [Myxococcota bacterium]